MPSYRREEGSGVSKTGRTTVWLQGACFIFWWPIPSLTQGVVGLPLAQPPGWPTSADTVCFPALAAEGRGRGCRFCRRVMLVICAMECWCAERKRCRSCQGFLHRNKTSIHILLNFQDLIRSGTKLYSFFTQQEHEWSLGIGFLVIFLFKNFRLIQL